MVKLFGLSALMRPVPEHEMIGQTYLGQAHIAGTGPEGKTCRECRWFGPPGYSGGVEKGIYASCKSGGKLRPQKCNRPIANKAPDRIPYDAKACRLFEQRDAPMPIIRPDWLEWSARQAARKKKGKQNG